MQGEELVIDEGEAAIQSEAPPPRGPLPDRPTVPGTHLHCVVLHDVLGCAVVLGCGVVLGGMV